jgi:hypothetical protein
MTFAKDGGEIVGTFRQDASSPAGKVAGRAGFRALAVRPDASAVLAESSRCGPSSEREPSAQAAS